MPPKRKFNSRFPSARIKKIMQSDDDIGKVSAPVPLVVSRAVEVFLESLLSKAQEQLEKSKTASKTLSPAHLKRCIETEPKFDFLRDLVQHVADIRPTTPEIASRAQSLAMNHKHPTASGPLGPSSSCTTPTGDVKRKRGRPPGSGKKSGDGTAVKKPKQVFFNADGTPYKPRRGRKSKAWKDAVARGENPLLVLGQTAQPSITSQVPPSVIHTLPPPPIAPDQPLGPQEDMNAHTHSRLVIDGSAPSDSPAPASTSNLLVPSAAPSNDTKSKSPTPHLNSYNMSAILNREVSEDDDYDS